MALIKQAITEQQAKEKSDSVYIGVKLPIADADELAGLLGLKLSDGGAGIARALLGETANIVFDGPVREPGESDTLYVGVKVTKAKNAEICNALAIDPETGGTTTFKTALTKLLIAKGILNPDGTPKVQ